MGKWHAPTLRGGDPRTGRFSQGRRVRAARATASGYESQRAGRGGESFRIQERAPQPRGRGRGRPAQTRKPGLRGPGPQDASRSASPRRKVGSMGKEAASPTQVPPRPGAVRPELSPQTRVHPVTPRLTALNGLPGLNKVHVGAGPWRASRGPGRPSVAPRQDRGPPPPRHTYLPHPPPTRAATQGAPKVRDPGSPPAGRQAREDRPG